MKRVKQHISTSKLFKAFMLLFVAAGLIFFVSTKLVEKHSSVVKDISISIIGEGDGQFVDEEDVMSEILIYIEGQEITNLKELKLSKLEEILEQESHIARADLYVGMLGKLNVKVFQHVPIFRIIDKDNKNVYLSDAGLIFPKSSKYTSNVPVVTGRLSIENQKYIDDLLKLQSFIQKEKWLGKLIQQIKVNKLGHYEISPLIGDFTIVLGEMENLQSKFEQLYVFYKKALPAKGWNKYKKLDLSFENQIVCTKK